MRKIILFFLLIACAPALSAQRNPAWAIPVNTTYTGNFYKIDEGVYRCEQPDAKSFAELQRMGIKEVLNLRNFHSDNDEAKNTLLTLNRIKMRAADPDEDEVVNALRIIKNRKGDIVIHCWHGSDRTGLVAAMYRIVFQGWTKEAAIDELKNGGYGYHSTFKDIPVFIENADVENIKSRVMK